MNYYAYIHAVPGGAPFYVGKGSRLRYRPKVGARSVEYKEAARYGVDVAVIPCSSEAIAFELERGLIKCLRRMDVPLVNKASGGAGPNSGVCRVFINGESLVDLTRKAAVCYDTLHQRISSGWDAAAAANTPASKHNNGHYRFHIYKGVRDTIAGHCRTHGKNYARVAKRLTAYGYSFEDAMEK